MKQKIIRVGNSAAITLSKSLLKESGVKIGGSVNVSYKADMGNILIEIPRKQTSTRVIIDKEVYAVANDLLKRYLPAFKKLARPDHDQIPHD